MAAPSNLRPVTGSIPTGPGVYRFKDANGRVIYVGKAKNLRSRLSSYFAEPAALHPRTRSMVQAAADLDWTIVATEVEALALEYSWIKEFDPRFNVKYRDDKSYPFLAMTMADDYPRALVMRGQRRKGTRYFGPFSHAWAIRDTLDQLLRVFPVRTCSNGVFRTAKQTGRPCLLGYIDKCSAPCVDRVSAQEHREIADDLCTFMTGRTAPFIRARELQMEAAASDLDYERAARLRDDVRALTRAMERNTVVLAPGTDADVIAIHDDELEAAVQVFFVRDGRIRGRRGWVTEKVEDVDRAGLVSHFVQQVYGAADASDVPRDVLVQVMPRDASALTEWLTDLRGSSVTLRHPQRGDKAALLDTVAANAAETLMQHRLRRSSDLTSRSAALQDLQDQLGLSEPPLRIECIDISNLQGTSVVGSLVVFEDGLPKKSDYRRFSIKGNAATDDLSSVRDVVRRRFARAQAEAEAVDSQPEEGTNTAPGADSIQTSARPSAFSYRPGLLVVDGGQPQAAAAQQVMDELEIEGVAVVGLAKRLEEVWPAGVADPLILPRGSEALYLLQRVRDEAHRFAIAYHRQRRSRAMTTSALDDVAGLGPVRRAALLKHFGSVAKIRKASLDQIEEVPGVGPAGAAALHLALHPQGEATPTTTASAINTATGEIMDS